MTTSKSSRGARIARTAAAVATGLATLAAGATTAAASTSSATDVAAATSYGFACSARWGWVRQNWPDISVRSAENTDVRVHALLYRWEGGRWLLVQTSESYSGISTVRGSQALGNDVSGQPYYFALAGQPSTVPDELGYGFDHLTPGWYTSVEEYSASGRTWQSTAGHTTVDTCRI